MGMNLLNIPALGMDAIIQQAQGVLYKMVKEVWCDELPLDADYECYGRCYRNQANGGNEYIPEVYTSRKEYKEVLFDDRSVITSFFGIGDRQETEGGLVLKVPVHLIIHADVCKLEPDYVFRTDEIVRQKIWNIAKKFPDMEIQRQVTGISNVFQEYKGSRILNGLYAKDMHPLHVWRIDFIADYYTEVGDCNFVNEYSTDYPT